MEKLKRGGYFFNPDNSPADAIHDSMKPGARAGNEFVDNVMDTIKKRIEKLRPEIRKNVGYLRIYIDLIIRTKSKSEKNIENTLDGLLEYMNFGEGEKEFKRLLNYYRKVSNERYQFYKREYDSFKKMG
ncbi:hypothetical protein J4217_01950 [Candidatus Pacearchaeota archaeon]|nr:hypothetical protein [Candidatus Pacearchaeota archaeon]